MPSSAPHTYRTPASGTAPALSGARPVRDAVGEGTTGKPVGEVVADGAAGATACCPPAVLPHAAARRPATTITVVGRITESIQLTLPGRVRLRVANSYISRVSIRWCTFDCYGTLIDWEGGIAD